MKSHILILSATLGTASLLLAADFYDKKQFPEWSAKDAPRMLLACERFYIVSIVGAPPRLPGAEASIEVYGKDSIRSVDVKSGREGSSNVLYFVFPREPITLENKEVELVFKLGTMNLRRKF